ncbi:DUF3801 domain-containing protein [Bifidobacterium miconisargentati]|uniref:DUF3801 domain-containing protein n=1 Tax=Bifidobacterium miconisargentati TaxID=2834437 RepID=UPI001BDC3E3B|nr:DUF3801 domain-containing protein [Bifidobacterium miconisargentati]MBW3090107.1 DUF3801 domain-containing protein [Bifidobacterium miconisargentati]
MIEERLEDVGRQTTMEVTRTGAGLTLRVGEWTAAWFLRAGARAFSGMSDAARQVAHTGRMSEKRLQRAANGDIHIFELDREQVRAVMSSLDRAGVRYAVERGEDATWVHFEGRDLDHVTHAVRRALGDVGYELRLIGHDAKVPDQSPESTESHSRNQPSQTASAPKEEKISKEDTLNELHERIDRKLSGNTGQTIPPRKHERTRSR